MIGKFVTFIDDTKNIYKDNITVIDICNNVLFLSVYKISKNGKNINIYANSFPIKGFNNQVINNAVLATKTLASIFDQVEKFLKIKLRKVILNAPNSQVSSHKIQYKQELNSIVKKKHIDKITDLSLYKKDIDDSEFIISAQISEIYLDDKNLKNILGIWTKKLSIKVNIITIYKPYLQILKEIFDYLSLKLMSIIYIPNIFTQNEITKKDTFAFLNIEEEETLIGSYIDGNLNTIKIIPIGYNHIYEKIIPIFNINLPEIQKTLQTAKLKFNSNIGDIKIQSNDKSIKIPYNEFITIIEKQILEFLRSNCISKHLKNLLYNQSIIYICSNDIISSIIDSIIYKQTHDYNIKNNELIGYIPFFSDRQECIRLKLMIKYYLNERNQNKAIYSFNNRLFEI